MKKSAVKKLLAMVLMILIALSLVSCGGGEATEPETDTPPTTEESTPTDEESSSPDEPASGDEITISFALWDEVQFPAFEKIAEKFESEHPGIKVDLQLTPWDQYWTKLDASAEAGTAADIFWMNEYLPKYTEAGLIEPVGPLMDKEGIDKSQWVEAMVELYSIDGELQTMPKGIDAVVVAYNKSIFDKYGVSYPEEGWTWDDLAAKGAELRDAIKAEGGTEYPLGMELDSQPSYYQFMIQNGVKIYTEDSNGFAEQGSIDAFTDVVNLLDEEIMPDFKILSDTKATDLFLSEKCAMIYVGSWKAAVLENASFASNIGLVTMPKKEVNNNCAVGGITYALNANSEHMDEAWELIKYLGGEESNKIQAEMGVDIPAFKSVQSSYNDGFTNLDPTAFVKQTENSATYPNHPAMANWSTDLEEIAGQIFSKQVTPEEGCTQISELIQGYIDEYLAEQ